MGSPFNPGRDSNIATGNQFDAEPDVMDTGRSDFDQFCMDHNGTMGLNERDYRSPDERGAGPGSGDGAER